MILRRISWTIVVLVLCVMGFLALADHKDRGPEYGRGTTQADGGSEARTSRQQPGNP